MDFRELLSRVLREQEGLRGLEVREVKEVECTKPGDNFMSDVTVAEVRGQLPAGQPYVGRVFVKRPPHGATVRGFSSDAAFANEALVYGLIGDVTVCAVCLHASRDVILLQDLAAMGYRMHERPKGLELNVLPSVLQALAKFHGASYVRLQTSEVFREGVAQLRPIGLMLSGNDTLARGLGRMQRLAGEGSEAYKPLGRLLKDAGQRLKPLRKPGRVAVLTHGDFWLNNIMVNEALREPVKIVDLQACAIASPAVDVWTLLYTSVDPSILQERAESLVDPYCDAFLEVLRTAGVPLESMVTADALKQVWGGEEVVA